MKVHRGVSNDWMTSVRGGEKNKNKYAKEGS